MLGRTAAKYYLQNTKKVESYWRWNYYNVRGLRLFHSGPESSLQEHCNVSASISDLQITTNETDEWSRQNRMQVTVIKAKEVVIFFSRRFPTSGVPLHTIYIAGKEVERIKSAKILGVIISNDLTWKQQEDYVHLKSNQRLYFLCMLKRRVAVGGTCCLFIRRQSDVLVPCVSLKPCAQWSRPTRWSHVKGELSRYGTRFALPGSPHCHASWHATDAERQDIRELLPETSWNFPPQRTEYIVFCPSSQRQLHAMRWGGPNVNCWYQGAGHRGTQEHWLTMANRQYENAVSCARKRSIGP